jgi:hypothetical protein
MWCGNWQSKLQLLRMTLVSSMSSAGNWQRKLQLLRMARDKSMSSGVQQRSKMVETLIMFSIETKI